MLEERRDVVRAGQRAGVVYTVLPEHERQRGVTFDISGGGIGLVTQRVLAPWTELQVALQLPTREAPVHFIGQVVWSRAQETADRAQRTRAVLTGLRISEIAPDDQTELMEYVVRTKMM